MDPATRRKLSYGLCCSLMLALAVFTVLRSLRTERAKYPFDSHLLRTKTDPMDAAISPDGKQVALVHRQYVGSDTNQVDLLDASTGQQVASFMLPRAPLGILNFPQYYISKPLRFCNNGKYILAFDDLDTLYVLDSSSLHPHSSISLNGLRILLGDPKRKLPTVMSTGKVSVACALHSPLALIAFDVDEGGVVSCTPCMCDSLEVRVLFTT